MLLDLEHSFEELKGLNLAEHLVLPINADLKKFKDKILKLGFPCWIKLNSSEHKLALGGVKKASSFEELELAHKELKKKFPDKKFIVQKNQSGVMIILGIKHDKTFGKILLVGAGGSSVEEKKDIEFRVLPVSKEEILSALKELKIYSELKQANISSLVETVEKLIKLPIKEADLNPVIVNDKTWIVDARVEIEN